MGIITDFFKSLLDPKAATWSAGVSFNRSNPLPLDKWSVFQSMDDAVAYAESNAVAYPGQVIAVYHNGKMVAYVLSEVVVDENTSKLGLEPIGIIPTGEGAISVDEDGVISVGTDGVTLEVVDNALTLKGYAAAPEGAQLVKAADGSLSWIKPDTTTVEGLATTVETLKTDLAKLEQQLNPTDEEGNPVEGGLVSDVEDLEEAIGTETVYDEDGNVVTPATGIYKDIEDIEDKIGSEAEYGEDGSLSAAATGLYAELETKADAAEVEAAIENIEIELAKKADAEEVEAALDLKANAADVYTKEEADDLIASEIGKAIVDSDHLRREIVDSVDDINPAADGAEKYIYMVPTGLQADDDKYDEYMVINGVVEKVGSWEVDLSAYAKTETVNAALALKANTADVEADLALKANIADVEAGLALKANAKDVEDALAGKVDKVEGSRLMTNAEGDKLAAIEPGAEVNYIDSVAAEFNVTEDRQLELVSVGQDKVTGLATKLNTIDEELVEIDEALTDLNNNKVDKKTSTVTNEDGTTKEVAWTLLSPDDQAKLAALVVEDGGVAISGKVNAENVEGLESWITKNQDSIDGLMSTEDAAKLDGIEANAEVNFINEVTEDFVVENRVLSLADISTSKVIGLDDSLNTINTNVSSLSNIVNGYEDENGEEVKGLVAQVADLAASLDNYVTVVDFNAVVGDLAEMKANGVNVMNDIEEIKEILQWKDIEVV